MKREVTISAVIPTRDRPEDLARLLASLRAQTSPLQEIIIVDAGDGSRTAELERVFGDLPLKVLRSSPSVCRQRNLGIRNAGSEFVFLCDDDMEVPPDYLAAIAGFLKANPGRPIVSGMVAESIS